MRKIREVLRLHFEGHTQLPIASATRVAKGTVGEYISRARSKSLTALMVDELDDVALERLLYPPQASSGEQRFPIDHAWVERERRRPGVTLQLLWFEYSEAATLDPERRRPFQQTHFYRLCREYQAKVDVTMRQVHRAGEKVFIDYSGKKLAYFDAELGQRVEVELFVAVLGASNYTYAEATRSQKLEDFCMSVMRTFEFFGGVPRVVVPDQLRSAVSKPDRLDPEINPTFASLAAHYKTAVIPARARKPRDKAKVEGAVLIVQRWIVAVLRNVIFTSLDALNLAVAELLEKLNDKPLRKLEGTRRTLFEQLDAPVLRPLPARRFEIAEWKKATVNIDYHVEYDGRVYSVPCELAREEVMIKASALVVEVFHVGRRVATHGRNYGPKGSARTDQAHRPKHHRDYGQWPPERIIAWAKTIGISASLVVEAIMAARPHPEQGYRSCLALIRDAKRFGNERTEAACERALRIGSPTRKTVMAVLQHGLDGQALEDEPAPALVMHDNVRGGDYFDRGDNLDRHEEETT